MAHSTDLATRNGHAPAPALPSMRVGGMDLPTLGSVLVKSGFFQDTREQAQAIVKVLAGAELGFGPIASMQGVYIVKNRVTLSANLVGAAIQKSGKYRFRVVRLDGDGCEIDFYEGSQKIGTSTFTHDDAKNADLLSNQTYKKFPRNMLYARALTNGARWYCPEVFNGPIYTPDELGEDVDEEGAPIAVSSYGPTNVVTGEIVGSAGGGTTSQQGNSARSPIAHAPSRHAVDDGTIEAAAEGAVSDGKDHRRVNEGTTAHRKWLERADRLYRLGLPVPPVNFPCEAWFLTEKVIEADAMIAAAERDIQEASGAK